MLGTGAPLEVFPMPAKTTSPDPAMLEGLTLLRQLSP